MAGKTTGEQVSPPKADVDGGEYATTSEIVPEAARGGPLKRKLRQEETMRLRQLWDEGVARGSAGVLNVKALRKEARSRLAKSAKRA